VLGARQPDVHDRVRLCQRPDRSGEVLADAPSPHAGPADARRERAVGERVGPEHHIRVPTRGALEARVDPQRREPVRVPRLVHRLQERELGAARRRLRLTRESRKRERGNDNNRCKNSPGHECGGCKQTFRTETWAKLLPLHFANAQIYRYEREICGFKPRS